MSTSTERTRNHPPRALSVRNKKSALILVCITVTVVALLVGGSTFWLARENSGSPRKVAQVNPTPTPYPTLVPPEITPPAGSLFYDTFVDNSRGWSLASNDGYFRILVNNTLILADTNRDTTLTESVPTASTNLDDYVASADFTINQGDIHDATGLYLRGDGALDHDYRVDINGNNTVDIAKEWLDTNQVEQTTMLVPPEHTSYLKPPGKQNTLTVIMIGPSITVEINSLAVAMVNDSSYASGQVALFVRHGSGSSGITVTFTRVEIDRPAMPWTPPTSTLTPNTLVSPGRFASGPKSSHCCVKYIHCIDFQEHFLLY